MSALTLSGVWKSFDGRPVLRGLDLTVETGELVTVLGPSGCGKTTALRLIAGLDTVEDGIIRLGDDVVSQPDRHVPPARRRIGMVFQDGALFPHLSVAENVGYGLPRGRRRSDPRISELLDLVGLADAGDRRPHQLSGGEQQRVALARALAPEPAVVLLDEPFANLDAPLRATLRGEVRRILAAAATTAVLVTHDRVEAFTLGDRVAVMREGRIVQVGPPDEVYRRPIDSWVARFTGEVTPVPGSDTLTRPEHLRLSVEGSGTSGVVERVEAAGPTSLVTVVTEEGELLVRVLGPPAHRPGDRVVVGFDQGTGWAAAASTDDIR